MLECIPSPNLGLTANCRVLYGYTTGSRVRPLKHALNPLKASVDGASRTATASVRRKLGMILGQMKYQWPAFRVHRALQYPTRQHTPMRHTLRHISGTRPRKPNLVKRRRNETFQRMCPGRQAVRWATPELYGRWVSVPADPQETILTATIRVQQTEAWHFSTRRRAHPVMRFLLDPAHKRIYRAVCTTHPSANRIRCLGVFCPSCTLRRSTYPLISLTVTTP